MDRRTFLGASALALGLARAASAQPIPPQGSSPALHDLMPGFWRVYEASPPGRPMPERAQSIYQRFYLPNQAVYAGAGLAAFDIAKWLPGFDGAAPQVRQLSDEFGGVWGAHQRRFGQALPDAEAATPAYVLVSFGQFGSRPRSWNGTPTLFFGLDSIAQLQGADTDLGVLIDHDAFLLYQQQVNPGFAEQAGGALWSRIWREGVAGYAAEQLNPGASRYDLLMDGGALMDVSPDRTASVAAEALGQLDSPSLLEQSRLFEAGGEDELPPRMGFLLGLLVVERMAKGRTLPDLARVSASDAHALVQTQLSTLAHG